MSIQIEAMYPEGYLELSRLHSEREPGDLLVDETAHQDYIPSFETGGTKIKRHDLSRSSSDEPELLFSDSVGHEVFWDDRKSESYRYDHPEANDALYSPDEIDTEKRNDYYEKLAKKAFSASSYKTYTPRTEYEGFRTSAVYRPEAASTESIKPYRLADFGGYDSMAEPVSVEQTSMIRAETHGDSHEMSPSRKSYQLQTWNRHLSKGRDSKMHKNDKVSSSELEDLEMASLISRPMMMNPYKKLKSEIPRKSVDFRKSTARQVDKALLSHESRPHIRRSYEKPHFNTLVTDEERFVSSTAFVKPTRQQFHEQGTNGPHSYKFGYSTGDKENPMARYEERSDDGVTRGSYSYVDALGKHQVVNYESHPKFGFRSKMSPGY